MKTDERLHLETSALENSLRNGDQLTLSTQLIKPNFLVSPPTPAPQFLKELARLLLLFKKANKQTNTSPHTHTKTNEHKTRQKPFGP